MRALRFNYLIARYYDPSTGQFLSVDPMVDQTGLAYTYTGDNPVNMVDRTGTISAGTVCGQYGSQSPQCAGAIVNSAQVNKAECANNPGACASGGWSLTTVGRALNANIGNIATVLAVGGCLAASLLDAELTSPVCIAGGVTAFGARTAQTLNSESLATAWPEIVTDLIVTAGTLGVGSLVESQLRGLKDIPGLNRLFAQALKGRLSLPEIFSAFEYFIGSRESQSSVVSGNTQSTSPTSDLQYC